MGILEEQLQMINWMESSNKKKDFETEFNEYINGFYDDYSYIDEYTVSNYGDLMSIALDIGIDVGKSKLSKADIYKIGRYNRNI